MSISFKPIPHVPYEHAKTFLMRHSVLHRFGHMTFCKARQTITKTMNGEAYL